MSVLTPIKIKVLALLGEEGIALNDEKRAVASLSECCAKSKCIDAYYEMRNEIDRKFFALPMNIHGVKMYAVCRGDYIEKYCNNFDDAVAFCEVLNGN